VKVSETCQLKSKTDTINSIPVNLSSNTDKSVLKISRFGSSKQLRHEVKFLTLLKGKLGSGNDETPPIPILEQYGDIEFDIGGIFHSRLYLMISLKGIPLHNYFLSKGTNGGLIDAISMVLKGTKIL